MNAAMAAQYRAQHPQQAHQPHPPHPSQQIQQQQRMQQAPPHKRGPPPHMPGLPRAAEERARLQALHAQQERAEVERLFKEKTRAMRPVDKTMPKGVEDLIVGDGVDQYNKIRDVEKKLDSIMMRKKLDLVDPIQTPLEKLYTLKLWISNTVENQPWQMKERDEKAFDLGDGNDATYKVKIEGRVIEDEDLADDDGEEDNAMDIDEPGKESIKSQPPTTETRLKLSHFFKKITIDFDRNRNLQPDGFTQIEWKKPSSPPLGSDFDSLEFERKGDENINILINLYRDEAEERHQLSSKLSALLDADALSKPAAISGVWEYVRLAGLQKDEPKRVINCDDALKAIFKTDQLRFPDLPRHLEPHLSPLPPLTLPYTIRTDSSFASSPIPTTYTLHLAPPSGAPKLPTTTLPLSSLTSPLPLHILKQYEEHTALLIQSIQNSYLKHQFLTSMAGDPVGFVKRWVEAQGKDLECVLGEDGRFTNAGGGRWRNLDGVEGGERVAEVVKLMAAKGTGGKVGRTA